MDVTNGFVTTLLFVGHSVVYSLLVICFVPLSAIQFFPSTCEDPSNPSEDTCEFALIECGDNYCPVLFQPGASRVAEQTAGLAGFLMGLTILFICLYGLVKTLHTALESASKRIIYKATDLNGYLSILIGCGITLLVQSSSITTSTLTPFVGLDLIRLEQMYPLTLGANLGTTLTGLLAALVDGSRDSLQGKYLCVHFRKPVPPLSVYLLTQPLFLLFFLSCICTPVLQHFWHRDLVSNPYHEERPTSRRPSTWKGYVFFSSCLLLSVSLLFHSQSLLAPCMNYQPHVFGRDFRWCTLPSCSS